MALTVRDEADIIEDNLRYHRAQGVDLFVVADNGSTDGTVEILERHAATGLVELERIPGSLETIWEEGATRIARRAGELGADWVIHADADEFWWPVRGNLKQALGSIPDEFGMVLGPRTEFVPRPGEGFFADRLTVREARFLRSAKTAHRAHPLVKLAGTHPHQVWVDDEAAITAFAGRPGLRSGGGGHADERRVELLLAPSFPAGVLHFPVRDYHQYSHRIELARAADALSGPLREAYDSGRLGAAYRELLLDDEEVAAGLREGWLVEDVGFRDFLASCPPALDPRGSDEAAQEPSPASSSVGVDGESLELDGMYALSRYLQRTARNAADPDSRRQSRRALRRARQQVRRLNRRLERIESSRWWRMRPRLRSR
jgi:hypothetical protein